MRRFVVLPLMFPLIMLLDPYVYVAAVFTCAYALLVFIL